MIFYSGDFLGNAPYQVDLPPMCFRSCCRHFWEDDRSATSSKINRFLGSYSVGITLVPHGLCWKVVVRLCCRAGKRLGHQAQEKCLWQGCLDVQSSFCQAKWPLVCSQTFFHLGPVRKHNVENMKGPSGHQTLFLCSQMPSPMYPRSLSMGGGCHGGLAIQEGWSWLECSSRQASDVQGQSYCPNSLLL